jgi:hypothetical protein
MYKLLSTVLCVSLCWSCGQASQGDATPQEDLTAKATLQGVWLDADTEEPLLKVAGDTLYYADPNALPVAFKVLGDSLVTYGGIPLSYKLEIRNEFDVVLSSAQGDDIHLNKAEEAADSLAFLHNREVPVYNEVVKKDSVVSYDGARYRGYVYINPSSIKVTRPGMSDEGLGVDNVYYDNIIHICVYEGKKRLFSKDISKEMLSGVVPEGFLQGAVLSDMDFGGVDAKGYHYQATVCIPDGASCYLVNLTVDKDGKITYKLVQ